MVPRQYRFAQPFRRHAQRHQPDHRRPNQRAEQPVEAPRRLHQPHAAGQPHQQVASRRPQHARRDKRLGVQPVAQPPAEQLSKPVGDEQGGGDKPQLIGPKPLRLPDDHHGRRVIVPAEIIDKIHGPSHEKQPHISGRFPQRAQPHIRRPLPCGFQYRQRRAGKQEVNNLLKFVQIFAILNVNCSNILNEWRRPHAERSPAANPRLAHPL